MLCITQVGGTKRTKTGKEKMNGARYYAKYLSDQSELREPQGKFFGAGLEDFGLEDKTPDLEILNHLFMGEDLEGNKLVKGNQYNRKNCYDLTFNNNKDTSIIFALASEEERKLIQQANQRAVEKALEYIQDNATYTRIGAGGEEVVQVKRLVAAIFEHSTARQAEGEKRPSPHLHAHCVVPNMVKLGKKYLTLHPDFYRHQMSASAIHSAELASSLKELGYSIEAEKNGFKIAGTPQNLKDAWSGRTFELLKAEKELKLDQPLNKHKRRELAALGSRRDKGVIDRDNLFEIWQSEAEEMGVNLEEIRHSQSENEIEPWSVDKTLEQLTAQQSTFNDIAIHKHISLASIVDGSAAIIEERVKQVKDSAELVNLGLDERGEKRYSTKEVLQIEKEIQDYATSRQGENNHSVNQKAIQQAIKYRSLSEEQKAMLYHCCGSDGLVAVQGSAGSGKSYSLGAVREAYQSSGYKIMGCALSAVAAQNLEKGSGIPSGTIHRLLIDIENGRTKLDDKTVLVIDEAGTADSRLVHRLIHRLIQNDNLVKLMFVGDTHQLEAIGLSFFRNLQENIGYCELSENRRQKHESDRQAVSDFRGGRIADALQSYSERGLLSISDDPVDSQDRLIDDWNNDRKAHGDMGIILASTNRECKELNDLAREKLKEAGELGYEQSFSSEYGTIEIAEGDRIMFTKNDIYMGVKNGSQGTVVSVKKNQYTVQLNSGDTISVDASFGYVRHSYAMTTHKSQGQSVSRCYIYSSGKMISTQLGYVQISRGKDMTRIYCDKESLGELTMEELTKQMSKSQQKQTALDFISAQESELEAELE